MLDLLNARVATEYVGRRVIVAAEVAAASADTVDWLQSVGADDVLVVAGAAGVGDEPQCPVIYVDPSPDLGRSTIMGGLRHFLNQIERPSPAISAAVHRFDPDGSAMVLVPPFATAATAFGRRVWGARLPAWTALEDKTIIDPLWDRAGVVRAPSAVVPVLDAPAIADRLDGGMGTVWTADNRDGWHGGGEYTRWLPNRDHLEPMVRWFAERADTVRVMPFLDGIPCSIHGFVTSNGVAAFRPVEMVILRHADEPSFVYARLATLWDPDPGDREAMRTIARRVGSLLASEVRYRGPFGIDGVMTEEGFRPTELNPRTSAGFATQAQCVAGLKGGALARASIEGHIDVDPQWLEELVVAAADANRVAKLGLPLPDLIDTPLRASVRIEEGRAYSDDENPTAKIEVGSATVGCYAMIDLDVNSHPPGPSAAPFASAVADFVRQTWGLTVPPTVPAGDVRAEYLSGITPG